MTADWKIRSLDANGNMNGNMIGNTGNTRNTGNNFTNTQGRSTS